MNFKPLIALAILAPLGLAAAFGVRVEPDEENVTAGRLAGSWQADPALCERLGVRNSGAQLEFVVDDSFLDQIPAQYDKFLKDKRVYEAGRIKWREHENVMSGPYLLVTHRGNPHLVMFSERDGNPFGNAESCNLTVVPGKEHAQDLLFVGGDFDNEPFRPFRRTPEKKGK